MARPVVLETRKLTKTYRLEGKLSYDALRGVSILIREAEKVAIVGPSGSGKSTLLNMIGTLDRPTSGAVLVSGKDTARLSDDELARLRNRAIGFVFQSYGLIPRMTALENVEQPLVAAGRPRAERRAHAAEMLKRVGLGARLDNRPGELSGGEQQRVAVARALVTSPRVVLADEPTGNLDTATGAEILGLMNDLHRDLGVTMVCVTHDRDVARAAPHVIRLRDGRIEGEGLTGVS